MKKTYRIQLIDRGECLEYRDEFDVFYFDAYLGGREWELHLPGSKGEFHEPHEFTIEEESGILPRLIDYLSNFRWLGIFKRSYSVKIVKSQGNDFADENMNVDEIISIRNAKGVLPDLIKGALKGREKSLCALYLVSHLSFYYDLARKAAGQEVDNLLYKKPAFWIKTFSKKRRDFKWNGLSSEPSLPDGVTWENFCRDIVQNLKKFKGEKDEEAFADYIYGVLENQFLGEPDFWKKINI